MNDRTKKSMIILLLYCIPYVFLGMYGDYVLFSIWPYVLIVTVMVCLARYCKKTNRIPITLLGNLISLGSSCLLTSVVATETWNYYFKAFPATIRTVEFSLIIILLQILVLVVTKKKDA